MVEFGRISHQEKFGSKFFGFVWFGVFFFYFLMEEINEESWKLQLQI